MIIINAVEVINKALSYVGYIEKKSNSQLDDFNANVGSNNYTKFARDFYKYTNLNFQGQPWCAMFVSCMFVEAYGLENAKKLLGGNLYYNCASFANVSKKNGKFKKTVKAGDIVLFQSNGKVSHTGLVIKVDFNKVYTVEGNTSDKEILVTNGGLVARKQYSLNSDYIYGYVNIEYDGQTFEPLIKEDEEKYKYGIDISSNQGIIDFSKVKDNVDFIILRSTTRNNNADTMWHTYLRECDKYNIPTECYKYSYAKNETDAISEANSVIQLLNGRKMRVWLDLENQDQYNSIGKGGITKVANAFIKTLESKGYEVGIYCNLNWYNNYLDKSLFTNHKLWIARYGKQETIVNEKYKPNVGECAWQYCSVGKVNGIIGNVDLDIYYKDFPNNNNNVNKIKKGVVTASNSLRIRKGNGTEYLTVGYLKHNDIIEILNIQNDKNGTPWYCIGNDKWVSSKYINII